MESDRELILEDARSLREAMWRMARLAQDAETLDARVEDEDLDGRTEAVEVREALEQVQATSLEVSEVVVATRNGKAARRGDRQELTPRVSSEG